MSALEEYKNAPRGQGHDGAGNWMPAVHSRYADAAIAELEAERKEWIERDYRDCDRAEQAEAALAKMGNDYNTMCHACIEAEAKLADAEAALATHIALCRQPKVKTELVAELEEAQAKLTAAEAQVEEQARAHAVEVTGLLRSFMGYLTALTASGSDMVTFVAQKLSPYQDMLDADTTAPTEDGEP